MFFTKQHTAEMHQSGMKWSVYLSYLIKYNTTSQSSFFTTSDTIDTIKEAKERKSDTKTFGTFMWMYGYQESQKVSKKDRSLLEKQNCKWRY